MSKQVNFGIIGIGGIGRIHAELFKHIPKANLVAIVDIDKRKIEEASSSLKVKGYSDHISMLKNEDIDAVYIATPPYTHLHLVRDIAKAGKHILCEKPLAHTLEDAEEIIKIVKSNKIKMMVGFQKRFNIILMEAKKIVDNGIIGRINFIRMSERISLKTFEKTSNWLYNRSMGGGVIIEASVHAWDLIRWITNQEIKEVFAKGKTIIVNNEKFDESFGAIASFKDDTIALVDYTFSLPKNSPLDSKLEIIGESGMIYIDLLNQSIMVNSEVGIDIGGAKIKGLTYPDVLQHSIYGGAHRRKVEYFIECILNDIDPIPNGEDGLKALKIAFAIIESIEKGEKIILDPK